MRDLQEGEELIEERAVGQVTSNHHSHKQSVLLLILKPYFLDENFEASHQRMASGRACLNGQGF